MKTNRTSIESDMNDLQMLLMAFDGGVPRERVKPLTNVQEREKEFQARVIDRLMHIKCVPYKVSRSMTEEFEGVVKWGFLFNNSPEMVAGQVWQRVMNGLEDVDF
jgi:hypothetical protein